jgi:hypothetical protein
VIIGRMANQRIDNNRFGKRGKITHMVHSPRPAREFLPGPTNSFLPGRWNYRVRLVTL